MPVQSADEEFDTVQPGVVWRAICEQNESAVSHESLGSRKKSPKIRSTSATPFFGARSAQRRRQVTHLVRLLQVDRLVDVNLASGRPVGRRNPSGRPDRATIRHMGHIKDPKRADPPLRTSETLVISAKGPLEKTRCFETHRLLRRDPDTAALVRVQNRRGVVDFDDCVLRR